MIQLQYQRKNNKYRIKFNSFFKQKLKEKNIQEIILFFPQISNIDLVKKSINEFLEKTAYRRKILTLQH